MALTADDFKRYRSGNCWVTAAILDEDETVELAGEGYSTVSAGMVLIPAYGHRYDCHSQYTFFTLLGFEEVPVKEVVNVPDNLTESDDVKTTDMVGGGTVNPDGDNEVDSEGKNHLTNVVVPDSMGTGTVSSNEGSNGGNDD